MIKRISFVLLLVAAIACGAFGYLYLTDLKRPKVNPLSVLPDTCFALLESNDMHALTQKLNQGNLMWEEFIKADEIKVFNELLLYVDSLYASSLKEKSFELQNVLVAFYQDKNGLPLMAFNLSDINANDYFISFLEKNFSAKKTETDFYTCNYKKQKFYAYVNIGLVMLCEDNIFLKNAINTKISLQQNKIFVQLYQTKNKESDANVFVHYPICYDGSGWGFPFKGNYGKKQEAWLLADVAINPSEINAQGFFSNDGSAFYNTLHNQESINFKEAFENIPYNVSSLQALCIRNFNKNNMIDKSDIQSYSEKLSANALLEIEQFIGDYTAVFRFEEEDCGIVNFAQEKLAMDFVMAVSDSSFRNTDSALVYTDKKSFLFSLCGRKFFSKNFKFVSEVNDVLLFANNLQTLADLRKNIKQKNTLANNERVMKFLNEKVSDESSYLFYTDVFKSKNEIKNLFTGKASKIFAQNPEMFDKYESVALTIENLKGNLFFKACANFSPKDKLYQNTLWETLVDTLLCLPPIPVKNHITNEIELVCADVNNNFYLLSNTGRILWKKNFVEKIIGNVYQVDFFDNGKLQLLFNTESKIYLIDRNGNFVSGYPIKLSEKATNGLTLFDYEHNKNYRLWIPQINNTTACYTINGRSLADFTPVKNIGKPIYLVLQKKDYFILVNPIGNIHVCNRKGENRVVIKNKITENMSSLYIEQGKTMDNTYLCYINKSEKKLCKISLTDKVLETPISVEETILQAYIDTSQSHSNPLLVCLTENELYAFDFFGNKLYSMNVAFKNSINLKSLLFKGTYMYAALEKSTNKLFLMNAINNKIIDTEMKLSTLPMSCQLIATQKPYLIGFYGNKVFCVKQ